jgi:pyruvate/2-oxoglutarate/acetoin dehydrogenase E1 component
MTYREELTRAMTWLGGDPRTVFLGQAVAYPGTAMTGTLDGVPDGQKMEMPVCEDMQAGIATGLAIGGFIPVSIFPRWNFMLLATNQIVNHLDKIPLFSEYRPRVIIRVGVGSERPLFPGHQHIGNYAAAFRDMCETVTVKDLTNASQIFPAYQEAMDRRGSTILVEHSDFYDER